MQDYKFLEQFINYNFINKNNIIYQSVEVVPEINSVTILLVEQTEGAIYLFHGYSTSKDRPIEADNMNKICINKSILNDIIKNLK